jgi:hypothetical protein
MKERDDTLAGKKLNELLSKYTPPAEYAEILEIADNVVSRVDKEKRFLEVTADFPRIIEKSTLYDIQKQDMHSGASGCGCAASVLCGYLLSQMEEGKLKKILFCGTGALLSPTSTQQNLPIPGICHAICIARR